jgi:hypothetical protein
MFYFINTYLKEIGYGEFTISGSVRFSNGDFVKKMTDSGFLYTSPENGDVVVNLDKSFAEFKDGGGNEMRWKYETYNVALVGLSAKIWFPSFIGVHLISETVSATICRYSSNDYINVLMMLLESHGKNGDIKYRVSRGKYIEPSISDVNGVVISLSVLEYGSGNWVILHLPIKYIITVDPLSLDKRLLGDIVKVFSFGYFRGCAPKKFGVKKLTDVEANKTLLKVFDKVIAAKSRFKKYKNSELTYDSKVLSYMQRSIN